MKSKQRGGQPGNLNALKHGFYSEQFKTTEIEDIEALTRFFITRYKTKYQLSLSLHVQDEIYSLLMSHEFQGNIRELENLISKVMLTKSSGNSHLTVNDFMPYLDEPDVYKTENRNQPSLNEFLTKV